ncbi:MAG: preprotein translocase subunit SecE [Chloroflexi bacterium]|nr:preprotein translocase subunit SecE [Chloroflexota bacterium]
MSKVNARKNDVLGEEELDDNYDELEGEEYDEEEYEDESDDDSIPSGSQVVVSDSRARRKRNRGEAFETVAPGPATTEKKNRPTPSRRDAKGVATTGNRIESLPVIGSLVTYFRNVYTEMQKVTWPTREETIRLTRIVLSVTVGFSLALGGLDIFYSWWMHTELLNNEGGFLGVAAVFVVLLGIASWYLFYREDEALPY